MPILRSGIRERAELKKTQTSWYAPQKSHNIQGPRYLPQVNTIVFGEQFRGKWICMTVIHPCFQLLRNISLTWNLRHSNWKYLVQSFLSLSSCSEEEPWPVAFYHAQSQWASVSVSQECVIGKKADGAEANVRVHLYPLDGRMFLSLSLTTAAIIYATSKSVHKKEGKCESTAYRTKYNSWSHLLHYAPGCMAPGPLAL